MPSPRLNTRPRKRKEVNAQKLDRITPELAQALAERIRAETLQTDEALRGHPYAVDLLHHVEVTTQARATEALLIKGPSWKPKPLSPPPPPERHDPLAGMTDDQADKLATLNTALADSSAKALARRNLSAILPRATAHAKRLGFTIGQDTHGLKEALALCLVAEQTARQEAIARDQGAVIQTPVDVKPPPPATPRQVFTIRNVFDRWKSSTPRKADTVRAVGLVVSLMEEHLGKTRDITDLTGC